LVEKFLDTVYVDFAIGILRYEDLIPVNMVPVSTGKDENKGGGQHRNKN